MPAFAHPDENGRRGDDCRNRIERLMKGLVIIGARGFGREVSEAAKDCIGFGTEFVVKGFLDDDPHALDTTPGYPPILGPVEDYQPAGDDVFACGLGAPRWQKHYADIILQKGGRFINLIHRTATIGKNTVLGSGCIILRGVDISCDITLGDFVTCQQKNPLMIKRFQI